MSMNFLTDALRRVPEYRALENAVKRGKTPAAVTGVASVHKANIVHALLAETEKPGLLRPLHILMVHDEVSLKR